MKNSEGFALRLTNEQVNINRIFEKKHVFFELFHF